MPIPHEEASGIAVMESTMRILGIDPGLRITGYGCVQIDDVSNVTIVEAGIIRVPTSAPLERRLHHLHTELDQVIDHASYEVARHGRKRLVVEAIELLVVQHTALG